VHELDHHPARNKYMLLRLVADCRVGQAEPTPTAVLRWRARADSAVLEPVAGVLD
jgi:hypothetical protein